MDKVYNKIMKKDVVTFYLTEEDITRYRQQIEDFPIKDEYEIIGQLPAKLKKISHNKFYSSFVIELIENIELLFNLISEVKGISDHTRKMILFTLSYFVKENDEIPDVLDWMGYLDDAVLIQWVINEIKTTEPTLFLKEDPAR